MQKSFWKVQKEIKRNGYEQKYVRRESSDDLQKMRSLVHHQQKLTYFKIDTMCLVDIVTDFHPYQQPTLSNNKGLYKEKTFANFTHFLI